MKNLIGLCLLFAMLSSTYAQRRLSKSLPVPNIYSILTEERLKYDHSSGPITYSNRQHWQLDVRKQINSLKKLKGLSQGTFTYMVAERDSFAHQIWTSKTASQTTKKIEIFTQKGKFINKMCVELIRITRSEQPYLIEIKTAVDQPLVRLKVDNAEYTVVYKAIVVGSYKAYALLDENMKAIK